MTVAAHPIFSAGDPAMPALSSPDSRHIAIGADHPPDGTVKPVTPYEAVLRNPTCALATSVSERPEVETSAILGYN
ncbi:hypothetical protein [Burkholderia plantarii]|nr:hypothetical protein [Burkholderia plantarii]